ncbi:hypothetical protein NB688_003894 [Xanthomonas sacchari]|uniref:MoxR-vWA-beta-propeller ternary system domain-containing protein n=1 Tax=Xanthomonas sacchari TaxID=56458 RepID=A0ABT3DWH3_9XANT|nr:MULTISPECIES: hypothetical protein [Xanthomonas]MCW0399842.1 hypothetical protein [Xanthomonas sacchari]MCW0421728.1 hypothetical protein [Xanthomonas sacchari]MCW0425536.1 hypothetical protein [Xanthomonas sacchari]MDQ7760220.1 hypothetical protein [Xanthomonas sontii]TYD35062.1 hypothetical protein CEK63_09635 [Xanthomonas sontii]
MTWGWQDDPAPPPPQGVVGVGRQRAQRLLACVARSAQPDVLMVAATADLVVVTGPEAALPWIDEGQYIAPRPAAPALWLPTTQCPDIPLDLLAQAVARRHPGAPWLLLRTPSVLVPLQRLLPAGAAVLEQIRRRWAV